MKYKLNSIMAWTTHAGGKVTNKVGKIVEVIPAGNRPKPRTGLYADRIGKARDHESYVIAIGNKHFWPIVSKLSMIQGEIDNSLPKKPKPKKTTKTSKSPEKSVISKVMAGETYQSDEDEIINYIGIALDMSGSMSPLRTEAVVDVNNLLDSISKASIETGQKTIVSIVHFGNTVDGGDTIKGNYHHLLGYKVKGSSINQIKRYTYKDYDVFGGTPMYDAVMVLMDEFEEIHNKNESMANPKNISFLIATITDGYENRSHTPESVMRERTQKLQATDKFSFTYRVPEGHKNNFSVNTGTTINNIAEWNVSEKGLRSSSKQTTSSVSGFYTQRASGATSTKTFYANLDANSTTIKTKLEDLTPKLRFLPVTEDTVIKDFAELHGETYRTGFGYYQLVKSPRPVLVQSYKEILVRDNVDGKVYGGEDSRNLLGVPLNEDFKLKPGSTGNFDVFIQSSSVNRKLFAGTTLLYRKG